MIGRFSLLGFGSIKFKTVDQTEPNKIFLVFLNSYVRKGGVLIEYICLISD